MLLEILLLIGTLEKAIGNSVRVTFESHGGEEGVFPTGLKLRAEWLVERHLIRLEHIIEARDLAEAKGRTDLESYLLNVFIIKAQLGHRIKSQEIRSNIETEIRNAAKTKEHQDR